MKLLLLLLGISAAVLAEQETESKWIAMVQKVNATAAQLRADLKTFDIKATDTVRLQYDFQRIAQRNLEGHKYLEVKLIKESTNPGRDEESEKNCTELVEKKLSKFFDNLRNKTSNLQKFATAYRSTYQNISQLLMEIQDYPFSKLEDEIEKKCKNDSDSSQCWPIHTLQRLESGRRNLTIAESELVKLHSDLPYILGKLLLQDNASNFKKDVLKPVRDCWIDQFPLNRLIENFQSIISLTVI